MTLGSNRLESRFLSSSVVLRFYSPLSVVGVGFHGRQRAGVESTGHGLRPNHRAGPARYRQGGALSQACAQARPSQGGRLRLPALPTSPHLHWSAHPSILSLSSCWLQDLLNTMFWANRANQTSCTKEEGWNDRKAPEGVNVLDFHHLCHGRPDRAS